MCIGNEWLYIDIDFDFHIIALCQMCGEPILEYEKPVHTEAGLYCEDCTSHWRGLSDAR